MLADSVSGHSLLQPVSENAGLIQQRGKNKWKDIKMFVSLRE